MRVGFLDFRKTISTNIFTINDVYKHFNDKKDCWVRQKIYRYLKKGLIFPIKRGLYYFDKEEVNPFFLANILYQPSYISCQSALFYYGFISDYPFSITSITTTTTKRIRIPSGDNFFYYKIKKELFFGFGFIKIGDYFIKIAYPEKALLDFFYINRINSIFDETELDLSKLDRERYKRYSQAFPEWVRKILK